MTLRVIHHPSGKLFATFALHQFGYALAAALDLVLLTGEQFSVATAAGECRVAVTPHQTGDDPPPP
jgi:hypothetical protein